MTTSFRSSFDPSPC